VADVNTQLKNKNITTDIKVDTGSNVSSPLLFGNVLFFSVLLGVLNYENQFWWLIYVLLTLQGGILVGFNLLVYVHVMVVSVCKIITADWLVLVSYCFEATYC